MLEAPLPEGVTPDFHCSRSVDLDNCYALCFYTLDDDGNESSLIVWKDCKPNIRPVAEGKRLRDLRPGDKVLVLGQPRTVKVVEVYR